MKLIFTDYGELEHVLDLIEDQLAAPIDSKYPMEAAHVLAQRLRAELLEGGMDEAAIADANELVWTVPRLQPDTWKYAFADLLSTLLSTFQNPYGETTDAYDALARRQELEHLKERCLAVLTADIARVRLKVIRQLKPLAEFARPFKTNADKDRKGGPIRAAIARELRKNPKIKNLELFRILTGKPPKGWTFCDNDVGRYIEGPGGKNMGYSRFSEVCLAERNKIKA